MTRIFIAMAMLGTLSACGAGVNERNYSSGRVVSQAFATGPISRACMQSGRKAANTRLCGCVQAVANQNLRSSGDQSMAAGFFRDPHQAQVIRQSDNPRHEDFWKRYKAFTGRAESSCRGL